MNQNSSFTAQGNFTFNILRGGQRSQSLAFILSKIGYRVEVLEKGYKSYREQILEFIKDAKPSKLFTIYGQTGSAKTHLLQSNLFYLQRN